LFVILCLQGEMEKSLLDMLLSLKQIPPLRPVFLHSGRNDKPLHPMFA